MRKKGETKRRKIIIYYLVAIVFPSIILGVLAFRGIKNDQALVEREQRRTFQESGKKINNDVNVYLNLIENRFIEVMDSTMVPDGVLFSDSTLTSLAAVFPVVEGAFWLSENNEISLLNNYFLYEPDNYIRSNQGVISVSAEIILEKGWGIEFRQKEYSKAIEHYRNALEVITGIQGRGEIYNSIARLQKKLRRPEEAIKTYNTLLNSCPDVYIQGNLPMGMVALLELGQLYLEVYDTIKCLETLNILLFRIMDSRWSINYPTYFNIVSRIEEILALAENSGRKADILLQKSQNLLDSISILEVITAYQLAFPDMAGDIQSAGTSISNNTSNRYSLNRDGKSYFVFLSSLKNHGQWGLIYNQEYILQEILSRSIQNIVGESASDWEILNSYGNVLISSGNTPTEANPVKVMFSTSLPSWTLMIYPKSRGILDSFIHTGKGIYFYIFLLIVIMLACGLFFTLFIVNNELRLMRMKSNFITTVSHEFKSPLTAIRQIAEMLDGGRDPDRERQKLYYSSILQESERLSHLIENILDFSKMEAGLKNFNFEKENFVTVVEEIVISCQNHLMEKGFQINLISPDSIPDSLFDRDAIKQVLQNLIDNACKYSGDSKIIEVKLTRINSEIIISVKDYGIGIKKDEQDKIFSRFYRAGDELTQKVKGSGIGLTIVKQIVEAHKGLVKLKSEPGKGSVFQIVLPLTKI